jgi:hypothetical protein
LKTIVVAITLLLHQAAFQVGHVSGSEPRSPSIQSSQSTPPALRTPAVLDEISFAAAGNSIIMRPVSVYEFETAFAGLVNLVRSATVAFTNLELNVFDTRKFQPNPQAKCGSLWLHATPDMAKEIKWMGFEMVSRANNHTMDYGVEGMNETGAILNLIGLVCAGSGQTLGQARAPAFFQTVFGHIAMISAASLLGYYDTAMAVSFPVNGKFFLRQRELYVACNEIHKACMSVCRPGITSIEIGAKAREILKKDMI